METSTLNGKEERLLYKTILRKIGESHGKHLREKEYLHFSSFIFMYQSSKTVSVDLSYFIQHGAPKFITRLDLSMTPIEDDDLIHLKLLTNLIVLDLTNTLISDTGMSHLASFTQPNSYNTPRVAFLPHLKILSIAYCQFITDRSLRYIPKMKCSLIGIDLTSTLITPIVANNFLFGHGYQRMNPFQSNRYYPIGDPNMHKKEPTTQLKFRYRSSSSDTIASPERETFRKIFCPQHASSIVTYRSDKVSKECGSKIKSLYNGESNPGYRVQQNRVLNNVMNEGDTFNSHIYGLDNYEKWVSWMGWWKQNGDDAKKDLIFILKPSTKELSSDGKRPLESGKENNNKLENPIKRKNGLQVKKTMNASTFLQNFQL
ncbi:unnamed protein product [Cunninghamella blakesleeana]